MRLSKKFFKSNFFQMILVLLYLIFGLWRNPTQAANPDEEKDIFYIPPDDATIITFDGQYDPTEWRQANYFTLGYEGNPEIELYGFWLNPSENKTLFLAIHIDDATASLTADTPDQLFLCFSSPDNSTDLYWFKLSRADEAALFKYSTENDWCSDTSLNIQHKTYSVANYWEAELKIPFSSFANWKSPFALYLRVLDYFKTINDDTHEITYREYNWPALSTDISPNIVPAVGNWAKGQFIDFSTITRPEPYFSNRTQVLYINKDKGIEIIPGDTNKIFTKIHNYFFNGTGEITDVRLTLQWAKFGISDTFNDIPITPSDFSLPANNFIERSTTWTPDSNFSGNVIIRAELQQSSDAIICNNSTRRDMMFIQIPVGETAKVMATVKNTNTASKSLIGLAGFQSVVSDTLYFYIDRSELDSSIADSSWKINLFPLNGNTLAPAGKDRFKLAFEPGETKEFKFQVTAPEISIYPPDYEWWYKIIHFLLYKKTIMPGLSVARKTEPTSQSTTEKYQFNNPVKPLLSKLRIQVTKEQNSFPVKGRIHHKMVVLGYFGFEMEILPTQWVIDWLRLLIIFVLAILLYWLKRFYVKKH